MLHARMRMSTWMLALLLGATAGCYSEATGLPPPDYAEGYAPVYYDGYLIDFDEGGRPFYYVNGAVTWVPETAPVYPGLVAHYRASGPAYHHWSARHGERYRGYRFHGHRR